VRSPRNSCIASLKWKYYRAQLARAPGPSTYRSSRITKTPKGTNAGIDPEKVFPVRSLPHNYASGHGHVAESFFAIHSPPDTR